MVSASDSPPAQSYYFFRERLKEIIKTGGENVYCAEIEQVLHLHPAVLEAVVVGVPAPRWDEEVRAIVVLGNGATANGEGLSTFLRSHLAGYKIPKEIVLMDADQLPRSAAANS